MYAVFITCSCSRSRQCTPLIWYLNIKCPLLAICLICYHIVHLYRANYRSCSLWSKLWGINVQLAKFTLNITVTWYFFCSWNSTIWYTFIAVKFQSTAIGMVTLSTLLLSWLEHFVFLDLYFNIVLSPFSPLIVTTSPISIFTNFVLCAMYYCVSVK